MLLGWIWARNRTRQFGQRLQLGIQREEGIGTLEVVLIAAVLIIIAVLFKDWIVERVNYFIGKATEESNKIF